VQPWSSAPLVQLALVDELDGRLAAARKHTLEALDHDRDDWRIWLIYTRVETKLGHIGVARAALRRAELLNPHSPVFARTRP
jgi:Tfp pilus assembly protein PilF